MSSTNQLINIDKKLHDSSNGMSEHTISMFFQLMHQRRETANVILNDPSMCSYEDQIEIMNGYKENIIKLLNL